MADFDLTQTGEQVQQILDDAPTTKTTAEQTVTDLASEVTNRQNADATLQSNIDAEATTRGNADTTLQNNINAEATTRGNADATLQDNIDAEATTRGNADATLQDNIDAEEARARAAEGQNATDIDNIEAKIPAAASSSNQLADKSYVDSADTELQQNINSEATTRNSADNNLQSQINSEATTRGNADTTLQNNIDAEETRARAAESQNATDIDNIEAKIPAAATSSNQLADKAFVNSSIATNTANFRGTSATGLTYAQFLSWANGLSEKDANDYVFWNTEDENGNKEYQRYKYDGSAWAYEYTLNNSSFTAEQWAAINSAITSGDKTKLDALPTRAQLDAMLAAKQNTLTFDTAPTANSTNPVHSGGIKTALDTKEPALTWDDQPTQHSDNPVKSGGLYDIWQAILSSIGTETTNRQNADTALQNNINSEASTRSSADTTLQNNINAEATTRGNADTNLQNQITPIVDVTPQALAELYGLLEGIQQNLKNLGECKAVCVDSDNLPKVCGQSLVVTGSGAPAVVPMFVGQRYHDTTNKKVYEAMSVTNSTSDWVLLN